MLAAFDCVRLDGHHHQHVPDDTDWTKLPTRVALALYTFTLGRPSRALHLRIFHAEATEQHSITSSCVSIKSRKEQHQ